MKRLHLFWYVLILIVSFVSCPSYAEEEATKLIDTNQLTISLGREFLFYSEHESDTATDSSATVGNQVLNFDVFGEWDRIVGGIKGVIPLTKGKATEDWDSLGISNYQKNTLEYEWQRIDGYIGYYFSEPCYAFPCTLYAGFRWSKSKFKRNDFVVLGKAYQQTSTEEVTSLGLLLGIKSEGVLFTRRGKSDKWEPPQPDWAWAWGLNLIIPLTAKVTNSEIPGETFKERKGYTLELTGRIGYILTESLSFNINTYLGVMYWRGSDWEESQYGLIKWPKNTTRYLGGGLSFTWGF